jgi:hypothetical protein
MAAFGAGWKWTHGPGPNAAADTTEVTSPDTPDGWTWDE